MLIFVLVFLALSAHCLHDSYNPSRLQKQINGVAALFPAVLRRPQVAGVRTLTMGLSQTDPGAPKGESCGYAAIEALRSVCQLEMSAGAERDAATFVGALQLRLLSTWTNRDQSEAASGERSFCMHCF